jgi:flagellar protein FlaG
MAGIVSTTPLPPRPVAGELRALATTPPTTSRAAANTTELEASKTVTPADESQEAVPTEDVVRQTELANTVAASFDRRLSFSYDTRIDRVVVKVIENNTEEVIRQIPPKELVDLHARLQGGVQGLILNKTS